MISPALYAVAIPVALVVPAIAILLYATVVSIWIVPDLRIERRSPSSDGRDRLVTNGSWRRTSRPTMLRRSTACSRAASPGPGPTRVRHP